MPHLSAHYLKSFFWPLLKLTAVLALGFGGCWAWGEVEKINVIGSHIKRTQMEGPAPILIIDKQWIEMSGHHSLSDVLRDLPIATGGGLKAHSLMANASQSGTTLRGMEESEILVLINGRRVVPVSGTNRVDLTLIPISVIENIEILKDGASALYGADAVGGVINVITKKNYKGGEVHIQGALVQRQEGNSGSEIASMFDFLDLKRQDFSGKGDQFMVSASYGGDKGSISYLAGGQFRIHAPLYHRDRTFTTPKNIEEYSPVGSPGSWSDNDGKTWNPGPGCPATRQKDGLCKFNPGLYSQITPQILQANTYLQASKPLADASLTGQAIYSVTRTYSVNAPAPDIFAKPILPGDYDFRISPAAAQKWGIPAQGPVTVRYRPVEEKGGGNRETTVWNHFLQTQASYIKPLMNSMEFEGHLNAGGSYFSSESDNFFNKEILHQMAENGSFNPLALSGQKSDISQARYNPYKNQLSGLVSVEPQLTGELIEIKSQPVSYAVGALGAWQYYAFNTDPITSNRKQWGGGVGYNGSGGRLYSSLYTELSSLIAGRAEVQLAGRMDYYSDFSLVIQQWNAGFAEIPLPFSPRAAVAVQPIDELKLRASWGLGLRVPNLEQLYNEQTIAHPRARDFTLCTDAYKQTHAQSTECHPGTQYKAIYLSNSGLQPEYSNSFNMGMAWEPVKAFSIAADYYYTSQKDMVSEPALKNIFKYEAKHGLSALQQLGMDVQRYPDGRVKVVTIKPANLSTAKVHGVDLSAEFNLSARKGWQAGVRLEHSHILYAELQAFPGSDIETTVPFYEWMQNVFGFENSEPLNAGSGRKTNLPDSPRWRNWIRFNLANTNLGQEWALILHNIPSYLQAHEASADKTIDYYWQVDVQSAFNLSPKARLIAGIQNILGLKRPENPQTSTHGRLNGFLYSLRGRVVDVRYTLKF